ncbi:MAG: gliding motility protein GldM [Flavobacteriales bacterium]|nr:gliding motility protein GldM [Flavobacteriales bacterium]
MASGNLSPRQKMINVMYLVLIALLALNVSKEILKSFHLIEVSFNKAKDNLDAKIGDKIKGLEKESANDPTLLPYLERAKEAREISDEFVAYIQQIIDELTEKAEGRKEPEGDVDPASLKPYETELKGSDNIELHAHYFFVDNAGGGKEKGYKSKELEDKINKTRESLLKLLESDKDTNGVQLDPKIKESVAQGTMLRAELEPGETKYSSWSKKFLEHSPLAAVVTLLTKIQSDAKTLEAAVVDELSKGEEQQFNIEALEPVVRTNSNVVMLGEEFRAEIFLAARTSGSENTTFEMTQGGAGPLEIENGKGIYSVRPSSQGAFPFAGVIKVKTKKGTEEYPFSSEYQAFQGQASIAATKMNMLYIGVENPISIAVPGVNPRDITASISSGTLRRDGSNWVADVQQPGNATISVSAKLSDGSSRTVGSMVYRVRRLPKPEAKWGTIESGGAPIPKSALLAQAQITAGMGAEFAFEGLRYTVTNYQFIFAPRRGEAAVLNGNGPAIQAGMKNLIQRASRGDRVLVDKIRANGPGGSKTLQPIIIEIQ